MKVNAEKLKKLRKEKNLTQAELEEALGLGTDSISSYEMGRRSPSKKTLNAIADFFEVQPGYLTDEKMFRRKEDEYIVESAWENDEKFLKETCEKLLTLDLASQIVVRNVIERLLIDEADKVQKPQYIVELREK